jgi:tetratricopeptide (TPR) repeat protein
MDSTPAPTDLIPINPTGTSIINPDEFVAGWPAPTLFPQVPNYRIERELGRGGMGVVYAAVHEPLNRRVALKMIRDGRLADAISAARFAREAEIVAQMRHPGIVQIYEVGQHDGRPYLTLEFVAGGSLDRRLAGRPLPPAEAAWLVEQIARAMAHAHEQGVVHRDLKPANVLLDADGTPKVTDFGLARYGTSVLTTGHVAIGTPAYMAPEQAQGRTQEIGPAADVYALGVILYECLTGRVPFTGLTPLEIMERVVSAEPLAVRQLEPNCPRDLAIICHKCLEKLSHRRYNSAAALADDLERYRRGHPIVARPSGVLVRTGKWLRRNRTACGIMILLFAVAVGLAVAFGRAERERQRAEANALRAFALQQHTTQTLIQLTDELAERVGGQGIEVEQQEMLTWLAQQWSEFAQIVGQSEAERGLRAQGLLRVALVRHKLGQDKNLTEFYQQTHDLLQQLVMEFPHEPSYQTDLACSELHFALHLRKYDQLVESVRYIRQAQTRLTDLVEQDPTQPGRRQLLARSWQQLAETARLQGDNTNGQQYCQQAQTMLLRLVQEYPHNAAYQRELATAYFQAALVAMELGADQIAETQYHAALQLLTNLEQKYKQPNYRHHIAQVHTSLANIYNKRGTWPTSQQHYELARQLLEQLATTFPKHTVYRQEFAVTLSNLGNLALRLGQHTRAQTYFLNAIQVQTTLATNPERRLELARSHYNLGRLLSHSPQNMTALTHFHQAWELQANLAAQQPNKLSYQQELARTHNSLALLYLRQSNVELSELHFQSALSLQQQLVMNHPEISKFRLELGASQCNFAGWLAQRQHWADSLPMFDQAIAMLQPLNTPKPTSADAQLFLRNCYAGKANTLDAMQQWTKADQAWTVAITLSPASERAATQLDRARSRLQANQINEALDDLQAVFHSSSDTQTLYELACIYAHLGKHDKQFNAQALNALRQAQRAGFSQVNELQSDPHWAGLRTHPEFLAICADLVPRERVPAPRPE